MERRKQILILVAIASVLTIFTVALAINGDWFKFTQEYELTTPNIELDAPFMLSPTPEYFQISVTMTGSGNKGRAHHVSIIIEHNRVEGEFWQVNASYVLALEDTDGNLVEEIDSGSFTDLREYDSYVKPLTWIPEANPAGYQVVLDLTDVTWEIVPEYKIRATVGGEGGIIESGGITVSSENPLYVFTVLKGDPIGFTITPDSGFAIDLLTVDHGIIVDIQYDVIVSPFNYLSENVNENYGIDATFIGTTTFVGRGFSVGESVQITDADNVLLNGEPLLEVALISEDTVSMEWTLGSTNTYAKIKYYVEAQMGEEEPISLITRDWISVNLPVGGEYTISDTFTAPAAGSYTLRLHIVDASANP